MIVILRQPWPAIIFALFTLMWAVVVYWCAAWFIDRLDDLMDKLLARRIERIRSRSKDG